MSLFHNVIFDPAIFDTDNAAGTGTTTNGSSTRMSIRRKRRSHNRTELIKIKNYLT